MSLATLPIAARMLIGQIAMICVVLVVAGYAILMVRDISGALKTVNYEFSELQRYAINLRGGVHDRAIELRDVTLVQDDADRTQALGRIETLAAAYAASAGSLDGLMARTDVAVSDTARDLRRAIKEIEAQAVPLVEQVIALQAAGQSEEARALLLSEARPAFVLWLARINDFIDYQAAHAQEVGGAARAVAGGFFYTMGGLTLVAIALSILLNVFTARSVTAPLAKMVQATRRLAAGEADVTIPETRGRHEIAEIGAALHVFQENAERVRSLGEEKARSDAAAEAARGETLSALGEAFGDVVTAAVEGDFSRRVPTSFPDATLNDLATRVNELLESVQGGVEQTARAIASLAEGDLSGRMEGSYRGAFADLQRDVNAALERFEELIGEIAAASRAIQGDVGAITTDAGALSARAEQQAASLEEMAATMEQMSTTIKANADNSGSARSLASDASNRAADGGDVVRHAVSAMSGIEESAGKISDIITVIDGIAFQTNLLALNAAVEAARAGDAGKGFAVVASEVRGLAQRSSEAARDIRGLIEASNGQVSDGVRLVSEAGGSLEGIVDSISQVAGSINAIAAASAEQASGVAEVTTTVSHLDGVTQENAAMAGESASRARSLAERAERLRQLISFFRLSERASGVSRAA